MQVSIDSLYNNDGTPKATTSSADTEEDRSTLDKTDFFELLCVQLQNQDPLDPQSNSEFAAQLAEFSALESMQDIETAIDDQTEVFTSAVTSLQYSALSQTNSSSIALVGKTVRIERDSINYSSYGDDVSFQIHLGDLTSATVTLQNENGETIRTFNATGKDSDNSVTLSWNGKDDKGNICDSGSYNIVIDGEDSNSDLYSYTEGAVSSVLFRDNGAVLRVNGLELSVGDILEVIG